MQILHLIQCTNLAGMEQATLQRILALQSLGHGCEVLSLNPIGALGPLLHEGQIPAEGLQYKGLGGWRSLPALRRKLKSASADALLMTGHNLGAICSLGQLAANRRVLSIHYHHAGVMPDWKWRIIYRAACARFNAITFAGDFIRTEAEKIFPPVAKLGVTLPGPFVVPPLPAASERIKARAEFGLPDGAFVIGNAGWLIQRKRFDVFLRVVRKMVDSGVPVICMIAGDGPKKAELLALSGELGILDKVRWLSWQKDLRKFYLALDVLLFNSDWDAQPRTPIEALALGTPIVASVEQGGLKEIITSDEYGFLNDKHDLEWLSDRLMQTRNDPARTNAMVSAARRRIAEVCSPQRDIEKLVQLLHLQ